MTAATLVAAADSAPTGRAGVYFFLDDQARVLYLGKAGDLRRRLRQHAGAAARTKPVRLAGAYAATAEVRWEAAGNEAEAVAREADLLIAFQPPYNAADSVGGWNHLIVEGDTFTLSTEPPGRRGRSYGVFPHLGRGMGSAPATACSDGYPALLRVLWGTGNGAEYPARLTGQSPPDRATVPLDGTSPNSLHRFLAGISPALLDELAARVEASDPIRRPALRRDLEAARGFYLAGPVAVRALRLRHRAAAGVVTRDDVRRFLLDELHASIGADVMLPEPTGPSESLVGKRAARSLHWSAPE